MFLYLSILYKIGIHLLQKITRESISCQYLNEAPEIVLAEVNLRARARDSL